MKYTLKNLKQDIKTEFSFVMRDNVKYVRQSNVLNYIDFLMTKLQEKLKILEVKESALNIRLIKSIEARAIREFLGK